MTQEDDFGTLAHELHRKSVAEAFWNAESESELREANKLHYKFISTSSREELMVEIDQQRASALYSHQNCTEECRKKGIYFQSTYNYSYVVFGYLGCGTLWACDGNWKLSYPVCMFDVPKEVTGFSGQLNYVNTCPNQPEPGKAFCSEHIEVCKNKNIPTDLKAHKQYKKGMIFNKFYIFSKYIFCFFISQMKPPLSPLLLVVKY